MYNLKSPLRDPNPEASGGGTSQPSGFNPFAPSTTNEPAVQTQTSAPAGGTPPAAAPKTSTPPSSVTPPSTSTPPQDGTPSVAAPATGPAAVPPVQLTQQQLESLLAATRQPTAPAAAGQPQLSEADFKKQFQIFEADENTYESILGVKPPSPGHLQAFNDALQAVSRQSVTIMRHLMEQRYKQLETQFQPVQRNLQEQTEAKLFNEFVTEYPALKDYGPMLREIADAARGRGMKFESLDQAKSYVAAQAAKLLGKQVADFKVAPAGTTQPNGQASSQQSGSRQMSTTSMGGRSGASGGAAPSQSTAERLFAGAD